jgi:hypothetical protein
MSTRFANSRDHNDQLVSGGVSCIQDQNDNIDSSYSKLYSRIHTIRFGVSSTILLVNLLFLSKSSKESSHLLFGCEKIKTGTFSRDTRACRFRVFQIWSATYWARFTLIASVSRSNHHPCIRQQTVVRIHFEILLFKFTWVVRQSKVLTLFDKIHARKFCPGM